MAVHVFFRGDDLPSLKIGLKNLTEAALLLHSCLVSKTHLKPHHAVPIALTKVKMCQARCRLDIHSIATAQQAVLDCLFFGGACVRNMFCIR